MIVISILFYFGIAILLSGASLLKFSRLNYVYQVSKFNFKTFIKNLISDFHITDYVTLLLLFISFIFNERKESVLTLLALVVFAIFYLVLQLRNSKKSKKIKSAKAVSYFAKIISVFIYLSLMALFVYLFGISGVFLAPFIYTFCLGYIFIARMPLDTIYFKRRENFYKKRILLTSFKEKDIFFLVGNKRALSFKNIIYLFLEKKVKHLSKGEDTYLSKSCFYEDAYFNILRKHTFIYVPDIKYIKPFLNKENLNLIIFKENSKDFLEKEAIDVLGNKLYLSGFNHSKYNFNTVVKKKSLTDVQTSIYLNDDKIYSFISDIYFNINQNIITTIYALIYLKEYDFHPVLNTNLFEDLTVQREEDIEIISFSKMPSVAFLEKNLKELDDIDLRRVALVNLLRFTDISKEELMKLGRYLSENFDAVSFYGKEFQQRFVATLIDNQRLKKVFVAKYQEDAKIKAYQFYEERPYIVVNIVDKKE